MNNFSVSFCFSEFLESWAGEAVALDMFSVSRHLCCCIIREPASVGRKDGESMELGRDGVGSTVSQYPRSSFRVLFASVQVLITVCQDGWEKNKSSPGKDRSGTTETL